MSTQNNHHEHFEQPQHSDELSLGDLFDSLWRQRIPVLLSLLATGAISVLLLGALLVLVPNTEITSLAFRLRFAGASEGTYPNGMPFQPADIVSPTIVRPVYNRLGLDKFLKFEDLKSTLTVTESSEALEALRREFEAKLSNAKLTQAERDEIEKEYTARREATRTSQYRIQFISGPEGELPKQVAEALLPAVLESWAEQAQKVKGAWLYDVAVPGQGLLNEADLTSEDYLVVVDMLRLTLKRVDDAFAKLEKIPGASLSHAAGEKGLSIVEARARLDDLVRFKIEPLFAQVYGQGIFRDRGATTRYLEHRMFKLGLDAKALADKSASIEDVLNQLGAASQGSSTGTQRSASTDTQRAVVIPQFGDSFMDRLMEVGAKTADVDFRRELSQKIVELRSAMIDIELEQNLYQALLKGFSAVSESAGLTNVNSSEPAGKDERAAVKAAIEKRFTEVVGDSRYLIDQLQGLHKVISEQTLQPQNIYAVTSPAERNRSNSLGVRSVIGILVVALMLGAMLGAGIAWRREVARKRAH